jgi:hypothetical protein
MRAQNDCITSEYAHDMVIANCLRMTVLSSRTCSLVTRLGTLHASACTASHERRRHEGRGGQCGYGEVPRAEGA